MNEQIKRVPEHFSFTLSELTREQVEILEKALWTAAEYESRGLGEDWHMCPWVNVANSLSSYLNKETGRDKFGSELTNNIYGKERSQNG